MLLAEDLLILLVRESTGEIPRPGTRRAVGAAVLAELAAAGRIAVADDPTRVVVHDRTPLGDPVLDDALAAIEPGPFKEVMRQVMPGLLVRLLDRLAAQGVLTPRARRWFPVTSRYVWRVADTARREELRAWLAAVLSGRTQPDQWSSALIAMLHAADAVDEIVEGPAARTRADEISASHWPEGSLIETATAGITVRYSWIGLGAFIVLLGGLAWVRQPG